MLVLLFVEHNKPCFNIVFGSPKTDGGTEVTAVDFTNSKPLDKRTAEHIILGFVSGRSLPSSAAPSTTPDAVMMVRSREDNTAYLFSVWVDETRVIYAMGTDSDITEYRSFNNLTSDVRGVFDRLK